MKRYGWLLAMLLFTIPSFVTLLRPGIHNIQDNMQYFRIYQMDKCLSDGQIPCRWVPDMGYGYGYPLYIYYSPGPYYLGAIIHALGFEYIDVVKILFIGGFVISGVAMFALITTILSAPALAFVGSMLYIYVPVRAVQVYLRGSLSEFLAMAIFPLLFLFLYRIIKNIGKNNVLWFGLSLFGLLLTHNLMSVAFTPILLVWIVLLWRQNKFRNISTIVVGGLLGLSLSSFYLIPLLFERSYVHLESMTGGYFDYRQHFVNLYQLFISNVWGYGSSYLGPNDDMSLSVGQVHWILTLVAFVLALSKFRTDKKKSMIIFGLTFVSMLTMFLMHERSSFIWNYFEFMKIYQFPWRFLAITTFSMSLISVYGLSFVNKKYINQITIVVTLILLGLYGSFFRPQKWLNINDEYLLSSKEFVRQQTASIFDYLPKSAVLPPNYPAPEIPEIFDGEATIISYDKNSNSQQGRVEVLSEKAILRLPIFDFPGMKVFDNDQEIAFNHNECRGQDYCFGQISFGLNKGMHDISIKLTSTWPRKLGDAVTVVSLGVLILIIIKKREWLS